MPFWHWLMENVIRQQQIGLWTVAGLAKGVPSTQWVLMSLVGAHSLRLNNDGDIPSVCL